MRYYEGPVQCPGCNRPGSEKKRPTKDGLCVECQDSLAIGRELQKDYNLDDDYYRVFAQWYKLQFYNDENGGRLIEAAIYKLLDSMHRKVNHLMVESIDLTDRSGTTANKIVTIRKEYALALKDLCDALKGQQDKIHKLFKDIEKERQSIIKKERNKLYKEGVDYGKSLLVQLNKGEITLQDFEKDHNKF